MKRAILILVVFAGCISTRAQGPDVNPEPRELIEMMTSFTGSLTDRPFVASPDHPAIGYGSRPFRDPVAELNRKMDQGAIHLKYEGEQVSSVHR